MTFNCAHSNFPVARMAGFDSDPWPVARNGLCPERAPKDNVGRPDWRVAGLMAIAGMAVRSKLAKRVTSLVSQGVRIRMQHAGSLDRDGRNAHAELHAGTLRRSGVPENPVALEHRWIC
jgi:hypothetical protein